VRVKDFAINPGPRYRTEGKHSGEAFREDVLRQAFVEARERGESLTVDLDGTGGYASSFLEEAFGGLVRYTKDKEAVLEIIKIKSKRRPWYIDEVKEYIKEADHE
jgi:hypothetical protein